jgi:RHS repeat-associated protein
MAVFVTPIRASIHTDYLLGGSLIVNASLQPYKYNGKELDLMHGLNTYDYGARQYDPILAKWDRVDPLAEKYYPYSPYNYCAGDPVNRLDPDGRFYTDFVDINTGGISKIEDGVDNVIAASTSEIKKMEELFNNSIGDYQEELSAMEATSANLNMTSSEFEEFAGAIYAESSGGFGESLGIVDVLKNRAKNQGNSIKEQLSSKHPYGVYGVNNKGKQYHNEKGKSSDIKRSNIHRAIAVGLSTDTETSNGAYFWDGTDIKTNSHYTQWGVTFTNPLHNLWNQKNTNGRHQLITTTAIGKTIFTKFKNQGKNGIFQIKQAIINIAFVLYDSYNGLLS